MSDPIEDAFKSLHQGNLLAAKDARIKQLEEQCLILEHKITAIKIICESSHESLLNELKEYNESN
jgi:uncharacterized protein with FMN-binding domain